MRRKSILLLLILWCGSLQGQSRWSLQLGGGWYQPNLIGLDTTIEKSASSTDIFRTNVLLGFAASISLFPNTRLGFRQGGSYFSGEDDTTQFRRKIVYRSLFVETYFRATRRLEVNFMLAPMWNTARLTLNIKNPDTVWEAQVGDYGFIVKAPENMTNRFLGFASALGVRYYLISWLALDVKTGFMKNLYDAKKWVYKGKTVPGPALGINDEPVLTFALVYEW